MEDQLAIAEKKVLVEVVKLAQKRGMKGAKGSWKDFLNSYDRQVGASLSDPSRRSKDVLVTFVKSFTEENDLKFLAKVIQCHNNRFLMKQFCEESPDNETPEQRLVRLTLEHPQYPLDYSFPSYEEDWVVMKLNKKPKVKTSTAMVAIDCEMVLCEDGTEACVKVCVVDRNMQVKLNELVNPDKAIADYRTDITGVTAADLNEVKCSLSDIQKSMKKLLSHGTILVGHSLNNDLRALKLEHVRVIDTSYVFKYLDESQRRPSLSDLCRSVLGYKLREEGVPHNCLDDACAAMKLVLAVVEHGVNTNIPFLHHDVPDSEMAKLLLHRIPKNVPIKELYRAVPGDFRIKAKPLKNAHRSMYSAFAVFSTLEDALRAYESLTGNLEKDSFGRPQKEIKLQLSMGGEVNFYVRNIISNDSIRQISVRKRLCQTLDTGESKKLKESEPEENKTVAASINQCDDHLKEIERLKDEVRQKGLQLTNQCNDYIKEIARLKQEISAKDLEIDVLHKIVKQQKDKEKENVGRRK